MYVPWSTAAADVLELFRREKQEVAAVVNELGETIGILTFDDLLDTIFSGAPAAGAAAAAARSARSARASGRSPA